MSDSTDGWAPPGFDFSYRMAFETGLAGHVIEASVTVPNQDVLDFQGALVTRIGGVVAEDEAFRRELYFHVGEVSVTSAQLELNLKRAIILLSAPRSGQLAGAEGMFSKLEKLAGGAARSILRRKDASAPDRDRAEALQSALAWSSARQLGARRNDVIHGSWWDYAGVGIAAARYRQDGTSTVLIESSMEFLAELAADLRAMSARLEALIGNDWLTLYLPRGGPQLPGPDALAARVLADMRKQDSA